MELIDKAAVVAEIKKLKKSARELYGCSQFDTAYDNVLESIDTLEVKEVDLEKEHKDMDEKIRQYLLWLVKPLWEDTINSVGLKKDDIIAWLEKQGPVIKDAISMDVNSETVWDDIYKFLRINLDGEKVKLLIIREK